MTLSKVEFTPGIVKDDTALSAEGGWIDADKVRFRQGKPQTIGGWTSVTTFSGVARGGTAWNDLNGNPILAYGTAAKLYARAYGSDLDITPPYAMEEVISDVAPYFLNTGVIKPGCLTTLYGIVHTFTIPAAATFGAGFFYLRSNDTADTGSLTGGDTINGSTSSYVVAANSCIKFTSDGVSKWTTSTATAKSPFLVVDSTHLQITRANHGLTVGQSITLSNAVGFGGTAEAISVGLAGTWTISSVIDNNTFVIVVSGVSLAGTPYFEGTSITITAAWGSGHTDGTSSYLPSVWSLENFGEVLLANRRGDALFAWQPASSYSNLLNSSNWAKGTGWSGSSGTYSFSGSTLGALSQNIQGLVKPGYTYRVAFTLTNSDFTGGSGGYGQVKFQVNAGTPIAAPIDVSFASGFCAQTGTYSRTFTMPANASDIVFTPYLNFTGTISSVTLTLESASFRVYEAPAPVQSFIVDQNRFVILLGTADTTGTINPMLVRWSDQANFHSWIPSNTNLAGNDPLGKGGRIVGGIATRSLNLIITDDAAYAMQYTGDSTSVYSFSLLGTECGLIGKNAISAHDGVVFWMSNDGNFRQFSGGSPQIIDCRVRNDAYNYIAQYQSEKIFCGVNTAFSEIWWFVPDSRDGTECSRYYAFNYKEGHWTSGTFAISTWVSAGIFSTPFGMWTNGTLMQHETGNNANGSALSAYLETAYFDVEDGNNLMLVTRIVPDFGSMQGSVDFTVKTKPFPNGSELTFGPTTASSGTQMVNIRVIGRQIKIRMASSANPSFWRLGALRIDADKTGMLR